MTITLLTGDCREILRTLEPESVHCVVTSPPYFGLRDYGTAQWIGGDPNCNHKGSQRYYTEKTAAVSSAGAFSVAGEANAERLRKGRWREGGQCSCGAVHHDPQIGLEPTPAEFVAVLVTVFQEVRRVLRKDGTAWLNLGDSYAAQRGGTNMPAETLAGGISGKGDDEAYRGRGGPFDFEKNRHTNKMAHRDAQKIGLKHKDLLGIPWRVAFALQADGWYLRQDIIWSKPNPMPESVTDRCTKAHEYLFLLSKSERYFYDAAAIEENTSTAAGATWADRKAAGAVAGNIGVSDTYQRGVHGNGSAGSNLTRQDGRRNKRSVWEVTTQPFSEAHFATFPPALIEPCILAGCPRGGTVLDPFGGAGTTGLVADRLGRNAVLIELNPAYAVMAERRIRNDAGMFAEVTVR